MSHRKWGGTAALAGILLVPGALVVSLAFESGGFFPDSTGVAAAAVALALLLWIMLAREPFSGVGPRLAAVVTAFGLFAGWTVLSASWSGATGRALIEFDRVLLYLLVLILFGCLGRTPRRVRLALWGLAAGFVAVAGAGFLSRTLPGLVSAPPNLADGRLSYPLSYWNGMGLLAALGLVLCFHLSASEREPVIARVLGAAALPLLGATLLLTFSRGGIGVAALGLFLYSILARGRALLPALAVAVVPVGLAVKSASGADLLTSAPLSSGAVAQGGTVALVTAVAMVVAALGRLLLIPVDAFAARVRPRPRVTGVLAGGTVIVVSVSFFVAGGPGWVSSQYEGFVEGSTLPTDQKGPARLDEVGNNGRLELWRVALQGLRDAPFHGEGAGTYQLAWAMRRGSSFTANDGHSLYLEAAGELGAVGAVLLGLSLLGIFVALAARARGEHRALDAALVAAVGAWAVHAAVDWDWELPAVTVWVFALGGLALGREPWVKTQRPPGWLVRGGIGLVVLSLAFIPANVALSQRELNASVRAFERGDCGRSIEAARASARYSPTRAEPFQMLGLCEARRGLGPPSIEAMRRAIERDPDSWEFRYSLAVVLGSSGRDPRAAARAALRLNPRSALTQNAVLRFATTDPRQWRDQARQARLPFQSLDQ